jgi:hypothetical protein
VYRLIHVDNLATLLTRGALHAPNTTPRDGLPYRTIHNTEVQASRKLKTISCGPRGTIHDYVPFYFGPRSVMLYQLHTGWVKDYRDGQEPLIYLITTIQEVSASGARWVFSDGHGLATFTLWYDDLAKLDQVDWKTVNAVYWNDTPQYNDRQRRKQAEFLVWQQLDWSVINGIATSNPVVTQRVEAILNRYPNRRRPPVTVKRGWYY